MSEITLDVDTMKSLVTELVRHELQESFPERFSEAFRSICANCRPLYGLNQKMAPHITQKNAPAVSECPLCARR